MDSGTVQEVKVPEEHPVASTGEQIMLFMALSFSILGEGMPP